MALDRVHRLFRRPGAGHKPWLARRPWRERRVLDHGGVRGPYFALALGGFGFAAIFLAVVGLMEMAEGNPDGIFFVAGGILCAGIMTFITYGWIRRRRFGTSVCYLETLPGVIGGWFKASVEFTLPVEARTSLLIRLVNVQMQGRRAGPRWEASYRVPLTSLARVQANRYRIPVRFRIPAAKDRYATWSWVRGGGWILHLETELPGMDFRASFHVPIFETEEVDPKEQEPEEELR